MPRVTLAFMGGKLSLLTNENVTFDIIKTYLLKSIDINVNGLSLHLMIPHLSQKKGA